MYIKNLEKAETLPYRLSMRKSSDYDSWNDYRISGRCYYKWLCRFIRKHIGESFSDVFSLFKKALKKNKICRKDSEALVGLFLNELLCRKYNRCKRFYVDDGIICEMECKRKNRDKVIATGGSGIKYFFNISHTGQIAFYINICFGDKRCREMLDDGITEKEFLTYTTQIKRFDNICFNKKIPSLNARGRYLSWPEIWTPYRCYDEVVTLKYRSPEYRRYMSETRDITNKYCRESRKRAMEDFNRIEANRHERPILLS